MEVLGEGASGCVVSPAVPCIGETRKYPGRVVSKLYERVRDSDVDMLHYNQFIRLVDPDAEMTVPILEKCRTRNLPSRAKRCKFLSHSVHDEPYYPQNVMPYAGVPLSAAARGIGSGETMVRLLTPLFRFVARMDRFHLVHFDIKPGNVLYDADAKRVRVIDYGFVRSQVGVYAPGSAWERYVYHPPEIYVLTSVLNGAGLSYGSDAGRQQLASYPSFYAAFRELYPFDAAEADYNGFVLELKRNNLLFPPDIVNRVDVFGAGACLLEVWPKLKWASAAHRDAAAAFGRALVCANPFKRLSPSAAYRAHTALVKVLGGVKR